LLSEAELHRAMKMPAGSIPGRWHSARLALVAQALTAGALSAPTLPMRSRPTSALPSLHGASSLPAAPARGASGRHSAGHRGG